MTSQDKPKVRKPQKITQLQCAALDQQLRSTLAPSLLGAFKYYPSVIRKLKPELQLLVEFVYFRFTIGAGKDEPGNLLQNIVYATSRGGPLSNMQILGFFLCQILIPYIHTRLDIHVSNTHLRKLLALAATAYKFLDLINFLLFIIKGDFRSVTHRLLRIHMKFIDPNRSRVLDFSLMNRQLLWTIFQNFLNTVLPLVKRTIGGSLKKLFYLSSFMDAGDQGDRVCMICQQGQIVMPQSNNACDHVACYYCIQSQGENRSGKCQQCGAEYTDWGASAGKNSLPSK